ncbi:MAG: HEPN domain-containing protein [Candidatus Abyssobacteria bacterium SURF_5]|uniref:HEPN domain-containing protein n=1 Tax=Abyssobacteria bacterium (strain SURF_5) TaxID=2093360 RepID=A0A3A4MVL2_ABYX5|nr:MAG: HEPN domain-containing protein [Candidatus Abyssubacteria bacterium SURF_5]
MNDKKRDLAKAWLKKAQNDLVTASQTLLLPDGPTDTVCFHAQQAVEKALKAMLVYQNVAFPKIHDSLKLLDLVLPSAPDLEKYRQRFAEVSGYAIEVRYPSDLVEPTREEALQAFKFAEEVVQKIAARLI